MDMAESNTGQGEAYVENPQKKRENGALENQNKGFTQTTRMVHFWEQVEELDRGQIMKFRIKLFR